MTNDINDRKQTLLLSTVVAIFSMSIIFIMKRQSKIIIRDYFCVFSKKKKEKSTHYQKSSNCTVDNALKGQ